ncbi:alpha beta hydrolase [Moniliophthora roreri MCA 2997]|uniref:Alpha beta hydrolase n=2 Tax=Moniliophthora roreri TaxID=221103 RepID=V2XYL8_MONRO|nr:alpha beta hydrolase [Moniliophthora roreri MCA 2997]
MVAITGPFHCLTYALLILPPLLLTGYLLASFPHPPEPLQIHESLASLPSESRSWTIYPEDFYEGGNYVSLPFGRMRYWLFGPEDGIRIVLVHGLSIPAFVWQFVAPELANRGFRVMVYDLYGRGYSDAPQTTYDTRLYVTQLALLMQHVKWDKAVVAGLSMGGAITAAFTANFPDLVEDRAILISSAGLIQASDLPRTAKVMSLPIVQTISSSRIAQKLIQRRANAPNDANTPVNPIHEIVRLQSANLPGYNAALSSSLRDGPVRGEEHSFRSDVWRDRRLLIIHGTADNTVAYRYASKIQSLLPRANGTKALKGCYSKIVTIEGGGHDLTISHSQEIVEHIEKWAKSS